MAEAQSRKTKNEVILQRKPSILPQQASSDLLLVEKEQFSREATSIKPTGTVIKSRTDANTLQPAKASEQNLTSTQGPSICVSCNEAIQPKKSSRVSLKVSSADGQSHWHDYCFKCASCDYSLINKGYYSQKRKIYCDKCMDECFGETCSKCAQLIKLYSEDEKQISSHDGTEHWHDYCYSCVRCDGSLVGKGYFNLGSMDGRYCAYCYDQEESETCYKCKIRIFRCSSNEKQISSKDKSRHWHGQCYVCAKCRDPLAGTKHYLYEDDELYCAKCYDSFTAKVCSKCKERIYRCSHGQKMIVSKDLPLQWHDTCYTCFRCNESLIGQGHFWFNDSNMYCPACYDEFTAKTCSRCLQLIYRNSKQERQISTKDRTRFWHDHCYSCSQCYKPLIGQKQFSLSNYGAICCGECYDALTARICAKCKHPIHRFSRKEKQVTSRDNSSESKYWHATCYRCTKCRRSLVGRGHYTYSDCKIYCDDCVDEIIGAICEKCKMLIYRYSRFEKQFSSKDRKRHWHDYCYVCSRCRKSLVDEKSTYLRGDCVFCQQCANKHVAANPVENKDDQIITAVGELEKAEIAENDSETTKKSEPEEITSVISKQSVAIET